MDTFARQVFSNAGGDTCMRGYDVETIMNFPRDYFQPAALGHVYRQGAKLLQYARTGQTMERFLVEFDTLLRKAEARALEGGASSDGIPSILLMQNAALSQYGKTLLLASAQGPLAFRIVAKQTRQLFDFRGGTGRQDALGAADVGVKSDGEALSYEAWAAYRKAGKKGGNSIKLSSNGPEWTRKLNGRGQTLNGFNRRTGGRNRCLTWDSEYHLAPKCPHTQTLEATNTRPPSSNEYGALSSVCRHFHGIPSFSAHGWVSILEGGRWELRAVLLYDARRSKTARLRERGKCCYF